MMPSRSMVTMKSGIASISAAFLRSLSRRSAVAASSLPRSGPSAFSSCPTSSRPAPPSGASGPPAVPWSLLMSCASRETTSLCRRARVTREKRSPLATR